MLSVFGDAFIQTFAKHMLEASLTAICSRVGTAIAWLTAELQRRASNTVVGIYGSQLDAHPIKTNQELLFLDVKSKGIIWSNLITPLQKRGTPRHFGSLFKSLADDGIPMEEPNRREVLVMHDMMGNYRVDRYFNSSQQWDDYRFYHWPGIDYFCYFSHYYITVPPAGWINAAHLHGVRVLGTFITEGNPGIRLLKEVLQTETYAEQIADALVRVCQHFCFEGWLINVECEVDQDDVPKLLLFLKVLRKKVSEHIPNGVVLWYDSVIKTGQLKWQNEVNEQNVMFFEDSDGILINYTWNKISLAKTNQIIEHMKDRNRKEVFFGIDVFGRGQVGKFRSHQTMAQIASENFSAGIFAPGWTFETLRDYGYNIENPNGDEMLNDTFLKRNDKFWDLLWPYFATHPYEELPFYTDFCLGSGKYTFEFGQPTPVKFFNLSRQSLQPSVPLDNYAEQCYEMGVNGGSCLRIVRSNETFRIFTTNFQLQQSMVFAYAYKVENPEDHIDCVLKLCVDGTGKTIFVLCGGYQGNKVEESNFHATPLSEAEFAIAERLLHQQQVPIKIPFKLANGWSVRYFGVNFNKTMRVKDIALVFKKGNPGDRQKGYLGSMYLHSMGTSVDSWLGLYLV